MFPVGKALKRFRKEIAFKLSLNSVNFRVSTESGNSSDARFPLTTTRRDTGQFNRILKPIPTEINLLSIVHGEGTAALFDIELCSLHMSRITNTQE